MLPQQGMSTITTITSTTMPATATAAAAAAQEMWRPTEGCRPAMAAAAAPPRASRLLLAARLVTLMRGALGGAWQLHAARLLFCS